MRTHYRNGDEIMLRCGCNDCCPSMINGVLCHETGCTEAWKDYQRDCCVCGYGFYPQDSDYMYCDDCWEESHEMSRWNL